MAQKITCFLVDDDELDSLSLQSFLRDYPQFDIAGIFQSPLQALEAAKKSPPDIIFLDIDMPDVNGLDVRKQLLHIPACVFITAYPDFALEGFELAALDYLIKPLSEKRFNQTVCRLLEFFAIRQKSQLLNHVLGADTIFIKDGTTQVKLQLHEVMYVEALNNYTSIITMQRKYAVLSTLGSLLKEKPFSQFIRIHRSFAVQKNFITKIGMEEVLLKDNISLPVGRTFKNTLRNIIS